MPSENTVVIVETYTIMYEYNHQHLDARIRAGISTQTHVDEQEVTRMGVTDEIEHGADRGIILMVFSQRH